MGITPSKACFFVRARCCRCLRCCMPRMCEIPDAMIRVKYLNILDDKYAQLHARIFSVMGVFWVVIFSALRYFIRLFSVHAITWSPFSFEPPQSQWWNSYSRQNEIIFVQKFATRFVILLRLWSFQKVRKFLNVSWSHFLFHFEIEITNLLVILTVILNEWKLNFLKW